MKMTKDQEIEFLNKAIKTFRIPIKGRLSGGAYVKKIRKYDAGNKYSPFFYEVDIVFVGELFGRIDSNSTWLTSEVISRKGVSKIKVNKIIRRDVEDSFRRVSTLFNIPQWDFKIKKVEWLDEYNPKK